MDKPVVKDFSENAITIAQEIMKRYWGPLYRYVKERKELIKRVTGFLLKHDKLVLYFGKTHLALEYYGPEGINEMHSGGVVELKYFDFSLSDENFLEQVIGFKYDGSTGLEFPIPLFSEDLILPTNRGMDKLLELGWNFSAQSSITGFNVGNFKLQEGKFHRIVNALFFDSDETGLKTRHVKWIDFIPLIYDDSNTDYDMFGVDLHFYNEKLVEHDANYIYPLPDNSDFKYSKLPRINRFIELAGNLKTSETELTRFLAKEENQFILTMAFLGKDIHTELQCEWQSQEKKNIKPDFFVVKPDGYADIIEFKLPHTKSKTVVGTVNRESVSAEINSYIAQTRVYKKYFEDPNNRNWFEEKYGFKVHHPKRILVLGRRWDFKYDEWKDIISEYSNIQILTYDDLIDGVIAQFYK